MPLGVRHGQLLFKSTTRESFSSFVDVDSVVISMLFDPSLTVPQSLSAKQLKQRERAAVANPFTAADLRTKAKSKAGKELQHWLPIRNDIQAVIEDSAASLASQQKKRKVLLVFRKFYILVYNLFSLVEQVSANVGSDVPSVDIEDAIIGPSRVDVNHVEARLTIDIVDGALVNSISSGDAVIPDSVSSAIKRRGRPRKVISLCELHLV